MLAAYRLREADMEGQLRMSPLAAVQPQRLGGG